MQIKPRAAAIVPKDHSLLLVKHKHDGEEYWVPPGGAIEPKESIKTACRREVREETGLNVSVNELVYYHDFVKDSGEHVLEFFFLCEIQSGELSLGEDPEDERKNPMLRDVKYASSDEIKQMRILPKTLKVRILKDLPDGFDLDSPVYLNEVEM